MSYKIGNEGEWWFLFLCAFVGFFTLLIGLVLGLCWLLDHVTITP